jgi:folate-dependent phosphoribosylglycinamide formyltransferase PurN
MSVAGEARVRLGLLVSGGGRTALNIAAACRSGALDATIAIVVAHRGDAPAVARCREAGLRVAVLPPGPVLRGADLAHPTAYPTPDLLEDRIDAALAAAGVELVCLAGYLRKFRVGERWHGRALNIHPGLLPRFGGHGMYGLRVHEAVLAAGVAEAGCTVHEVDEEYDHGPAVLERRCPVLADDTPSTLAERVFLEEIRAYPDAIAAYLPRIRERRNAHPR